MRGSVSTPFIKYPIGTSLVMVGIALLPLVLLSRQIAGSSLNK